MKKRAICLIIAFWLLCGLAWLIPHVVRAVGVTSFEIEYAEIAETSYLEAN